MHDNVPFRSHDLIADRCEKISPEAHDEPDKNTSGKAFAESNPPPQSPAPPGRPQKATPPEQPAPTAPDSRQARNKLSPDKPGMAVEALGRQALREWFHQPEFNRRDGLDDYDGDYRQFKHLGQVMTAHLRHQLQRLKAGPGDASTPAGESTGEPRPPIDKSGTSPDTGTQLARLPMPEYPQGPAGYNPVETAEGAACGAASETALLWSSAACAHGNGALTGCARCQEACAHDAIFFDAKGLKLRTDLCTRKGDCIAVCPTGALRPATEKIPLLLGDIQTAARAGQNEICAVFCRAQTSNETLEHLQNQLPGQILPLRSDFPAAGAEIWLAALAMGAGRVIVLEDTFTAAQQAQLRLARAILAGLGTETQNRLLHFESREVETGVMQPFSIQPFEPADWEPAVEKRALLWQSIGHIHNQLPGAPAQAPLYPGAPLGEVRLAASRCTLCMACVGACPTGALGHVHDGPQVRFRERDCIQCGLCREVCPEQAVTLIPRVCYDRKRTDHFRVLHQDEPLRCSVCGKPFATRAMVDAIARKLTAHWMYQDKSAKERLTMCRDCRIRNYYETSRPTAAGSRSGRKK